jgi:thioredoxin reductase
MAFKKMTKEEIFDVIIIGGGPAGVSAATYAKRYGLKTLLITKEIGGQLKFTERIFSNPSAEHGIDAKELVKRYQESLEKEAVLVRYEEVLSLDKKELFKIKTSKHTYKSKTVIISTGRGPKKINIPFDESVEDRTVNYFTDFPYYNLKNKKRMLLIGGGYCGLDTAEELKNISEKIYMVEMTNKLGGNKRRQDEIKSEKNIEIYMETIVEKIYQKGNQKYAVLSSKKERKDIEIDGVFVAVGTSPHTKFIKNVIKNNANELVIDLSKEKGRMYMTSIEGLYACGDCNDMPAKGFEPLSIGEGIQCAKTVCNYLGK